MADDTVVAQEVEEEPSYRMVRRKYFCYLCQKEYNKMVSALEPLTCEHCQEGFVEIVEGKHSPREGELDEEKKRVNEQYRIASGSQPGALTASRMDLYDTSTANLYGTPDERRRAALREEEERHRRREEQK